METNGRRYASIYQKREELSRILSGLYGTTYKASPTLRLTFEREQRNEESFYV